MHLADVGYKNPRWGLAYMKAEDKERFVVKWFVGLHPAHYFDTHYVRATEKDVESLLRAARQSEAESEREAQANENNQHEEEGEEEDDENEDMGEEEGLEAMEQEALEDVDSVEE